MGRLHQRTSRPIPQRTGVRRALVGSLVAPLVAAVVLAGCGGGDAKQTGEELIEGDIADQIGLGELDAVCEKPDEQREGVTFTCTATTGDGRTIEFDGVFTADDEINVRSSNLLTEENVDVLLVRVVNSINDTIEGAAATRGDISCPAGVIILDDGAFECEITDTNDGTVYTITIDTGGLVDGEPADLSWEIGDAIG